MLASRFVMFVSVPLSLAAMFLIWWLLPRRCLTVWPCVGLAFLAMAVVLVGARPIQVAMLGGYPNDSFWDLGIGGRAGVVMISTMGLALIFLGLAWKSRFFRGLPVGLDLVLDVLAGLLIYALVFSMSPQAYYTLYQMIFPDLPAQIVVRHVLDPRLVEIALFKADSPMSHHLAGVALWAVLPLTLWCRKGRSGIFRMSV